MSRKAFVADVTGALFWPAEETLVVADLHFEKGSAVARRGTLLPPYDTQATLTRLSEVINRYDPERVVALGDSLHDQDAGERLSDVDLEHLKDLQVGREWIWITGNHDKDIPEKLGGEVADQIDISGLTFRHEPVPAPVAHEIAGHLHPVAKISQQGRVLRRRCFVSNGTRLVIPAFGAFAGGLNILDDAFCPLFSGDSIFVWIVGWNDVYPIAARQLLED